MDTFNVQKIDIVPFSDSIEKFIAASLSPAKVTAVDLDTEEMRATVTVPEDQQSLAIGKEGQNARLANKLTKWKIDIKGGANVFSSEDLLDTDSKKESNAKVVGVWDAAIKKVAEEAEAAEQEAKEAEDEAESSEGDTSTGSVSEEVTEESVEETPAETVEKPAE